MYIYLAVCSISIYHGDHKLIFTLLILYCCVPVQIIHNGGTGSPAGNPHGWTGLFIVEPTNKIGRDHHGKGRLNYVGKHHLQFAERGEWFLKAGMDSRKT
jgi:hypothetical protein